VAAYFSSCNRNKYSVAVDFKTKEGLASHLVLIVLMAVDLSDQKFQRHATCNSFF